jgi:hypothetical protein
LVARHQLQEKAMGVAGVTMPLTGSAWHGSAAELSSSGYRSNDCVWNLAWNQLHEETPGAENDDAKVQARVTELINTYNASVPSGQQIDNPNVVTSQQITDIEKAYLTKAESTDQPFIGPLPVGVPRPVVDPSGGYIVPGSVAPTHPS